MSRGRWAPERWAEARGVLCYWAWSDRDGRQRRFFGLTQDEADRKAAHDQRSET